MGGGTIPPVTPDQPVMPSGSDLVSLGILTKPISEFDEETDIGTPVLIPYTDSTGKISLNNDGCIEFEVVGVNHHTSSEHSQTITLMTKNLIRYAAFDAKEPNNPNLDRKDGGNNRWSVSNIRQWLNSSGAAGKWFKAQHNYDEAPTADKVTDVNGESFPAGAYADDPGFLAGFSPAVLQHFTDITNITAIPDVDGSGSETTVDKVFLPSYTEMFGYNNSEIAEGAYLSKRYSDEKSRKKQLNGSNNPINWYFTRSYTTQMGTSLLWFVRNEGDEYFEYPSSGNGGIAPIIVIH